MIITTKKATWLNDFSVCRFTKFGGRREEEERIMDKSQVSNLYNYLGGDAFH